MLFLNMEIMVAVEALQQPLCCMFKIKEEFNLKKLIRISNSNLIAAIIARIKLHLLQNSLKLLEIMKQS